MEVLRGQRIHKEIDGKDLFTIPQISLKTGQKVGLIGKNGAGKTTLIKMMTGEDADYQGTLKLLSEVAYVAQLKEEKALSGGEQVLHAIKKALAKRSPFLILDEPTANLDRENRQWLVHQLQRYRGCLLIVSHDRTFLNQVAEEIWVLEEKRLTSYIGQYDQVEKEQKKERKAQFQAYSDYQDKVKQLTGVLEQKKAKAKKMTKKKKSVSYSDWKVNARLGSYDGKAQSMDRVAKAIEKRIDRLERVEKPRKEAWAKLKLTGRLVEGAHRLFRLDAGNVVARERCLFSHNGFSMAFGEKIGLIGRNGAGKSSFVQQILEQSLPGYYSDKLEIAYFSQNFQQLDEKKTVFENASRDSLQDKVTILNLLAMLGLQYDKAHQKVGQLSGGERVRLALVKVLLSDANLLILDEPTNFLDLTSLVALEDFLKNYPGSLLLISHDDTFLQRIVQKVVGIRDGRLIDSLMDMVAEKDV